MNPTIKDIKPINDPRNGFVIRTKGFLVKAEIFSGMNNDYKVNISATGSMTAEQTKVFVEMVKMAQEQVEAMNKEAR